MRVPNTHFDPESRQLQTARLEHLLSFSDLLLLLIAEPGLGRSHLLSHLRPEQSPVQPHWVQITPVSTFDVTQLLQALVAQLGLSCEPNNRARLTALHGYARALEQVEQQLVICVDDADYLSDNALELLINFSKVDSAAPKVLLAGLPAFEQRFYEREFNRLVEGTLHIEHLQPYTAEEARAFVDAHLIDGRILKDSEYRRLLHDSQGRPDQLKVALARMLEQHKEPKTRLINASNRWYWAGIGLVLSSVALALGYLYYPGSTPEENIRRPVEITVPQVAPATTEAEPQLIAARSELAKRLSEQEARLAEVAQESELPSVPEPQPLQQPEQEPEPTPAPEQVSLEVSELLPAELSSVLSEGAADDSDQAQQAIAEIMSARPLEPLADGSARSADLQLPPGAELSGAQTTPVISEATNNPDEPQSVLGSSETVQLRTQTDTPLRESIDIVPKFDPAIERVLGWPASHLTIQLLAAREERTADQLLAKHADVDGLLKLSYPYQGAPRFTLVFGHFPTRALAQQAVTQLPASLQQLKPWIRSVTGLKTELNQGLNP